MVKTYFVELPQKTNEVFVRIFIDAGRDTETKEKQGIGHLLDHYINGNIILRHYNLNTNAFIDRDFLWFSLNSIKSKLINEAEKFFMYVTSPKFTQPQLLRFEQQALINEMKSEEAVLSNRLFQEVLEQTLNGYRSVYGEIKNVPKITLEDLQQHHRVIMGHSTISVIVGSNKLSKMSKDQLSLLIKTNINNTAESSGCNSAVSHGSVVNRTHKLPDISKGQVLIYLALKTFGHNDETEKRIAVNLALREISAHSKNSPFLKLRKLGIYSVNSYHSIRPKLGQAVLTITCMPQAVDEAMSVLLDSLQYLTENGLSKTVIAKHKKRNSKYYKNRKLNNNNYFSEALDDILYEGKIISYREGMNFWKNITPEMTKKVYSEIFSLANLSTIIYR